MESRELGIEPVPRVRAHEEVARQLRELMQRDVLRAGERLPPERDLALRFQVSRATIRQALSILHSQGLVESHVGAGTFARSPAAGATQLTNVLRMVDAPLNDQLELRRLIEPQVARHAADRAVHYDLEELRGHVVAQQQRLDDGIPFVQEDSAFHLAIAKTTKNELLVRMVEGVHELLRDSREYSLATPEGMEQSLDGHRRILTAIEEHDTLAAHEAMTAHILDVERLILQTLSTENPSMLGSHAPKPGETESGA